MERYNKCGGRSATGNAKHIEMIKAINPIFDSVADNFEILCELFWLLVNREEEPPLIADPSISALFVEVRTKEFVRGDKCCFCCRIRDDSTCTCTFLLPTTAGIDDDVVVTVAVNALTTEGMAKIVKHNNDSTATLEPITFLLLLLLRRRLILRPAVDEAGPVFSATGSIARLISFKIV